MDLAGVTFMPPVMLLLSLLVVTLGAEALVRGASLLALRVGVSPLFVGLTIVGFGTSSPELSASLAATLQGVSGVSVGNVVGSNIFNILGIAGCTAVIHPVAVPLEIIAKDNWWMLGASALLFPLMKSGMRIKRQEGGILVAGFIAYMALLIHGL
jgi:cation:H+ antiporter